MIHKNIILTSLNIIRKQFSLKYKDEEILYYIIENYSSASIGMNILLKT